MQPDDASIQVHGHDFSSLASIPGPHAQRYLFASGSEEKVVRVFEAPGAFMETLASARGLGHMAPSVGDSSAAGRRAVTT